MLVAAGACSDDHAVPAARTRSVPAGPAPSTTPASAMSTAPAPTTTVAPTPATSIVGGEAPAGAEVTLQQYRSDEERHIMGVQVANRGDAVVRVATVQLDWPGLRAVAPSEIDTVIAPGVVVDLPIGYGDAVCDDLARFAQPPPEGPARALVVTPEGEHQVWPIDDVRGVLARVHGLDCRRQAMAHRVEVTFGRTWTPSGAGDAMTGELVLTRRHAEGPVELTGISGSVLLNVALAPGAPVTMDGDRLVIPILVTSTGNCTGHALADAKKIFDVQLTLDVGGEQASISVGPDPGDHQLLYRPVEVTCGLTGPTART